MKIPIHSSLICAFSLKIIKIKNMNNVLLIGSGGREHAIAWSIYNDNNIENLYCAPGNEGTLNIANNVSLDI